MKYLIKHLDGFNARFLSVIDLCYDYFLPILNLGLCPQTLIETNFSIFSQVNFTF
jgi:hypothetical protein